MSANMASSFVACVCSVARRVGVVLRRITAHAPPPPPSKQEIEHALNRARDAAYAVFVRVNNHRRHPTSIRSSREKRLARKMVEFCEQHAHNEFAPLSETIMCAVGYDAVTAAFEHEFPQDTAATTVVSPGSAIDLRLRLKAHWQRDDRDSMSSAYTSYYMEFYHTIHAKQPETRSNMYLQRKYTRHMAARAFVFDPRIARLMENEHPSRVAFYDKLLLETFEYVSNTTPRIPIFVPDVAFLNAQTQLHALIVTNGSLRPRYAALQAEIAREMESRQKMRRAAYVVSDVARHLQYSTNLPRLPSVCQTAVGSFVSSAISHAHPVVARVPPHIHAANAIVHTQQHHEIERLSSKRAFNEHASVPPTPHADSADDSNNSDSNKKARLV